MPRFSEVLDFALLQPMPDFEMTLYLKKMTEEFAVYGYDLEVDSNPPFGATMEMCYLDFPLPFAIQCKDLASSFAGKCHALLCQPYTKGRDWYDFIWYVARSAPINFELLTNACQQTGP